MYGTHDGSVLSVCTLTYREILIGMFTDMILTAIHVVARTMLEAMRLILGWIYEGTTIFYISMLDIARIQFKSAWKNVPVVMQTRQKPCSRPGIVCLPLALGHTLQILCRSTTICRVLLSPLAAQRLFMQAQWPSIVASQRTWPLATFEMQLYLSWTKTALCHMSCMTCTWQKCHCCISCWSLWQYAF